MDWIESHQQLRSHPKTIRLSRLLDVHRTSVIGLLQCLWWWSLDYAPDGDLAPFEAQEIADAAMWEGDPDSFYQAMKSCGSGGRPGFINEDDTIHDWWDFAGKLIGRRERNAAQMRASRAKQQEEKEDDNKTRVHHVGDTCKATQPNSTNSTQPKTARAGKPARAELSSKQQEFFDQFWTAFPKKKSKGQAITNWKKIKPAPDEQLVATIIATIERAKKSREWLKEDGEFIPHPGSWLSAKGWLDEFSEAQKERPKTCPKCGETPSAWVLSGGQEVCLECR